MQKLLLASNSPRRRQLLSEAGFEFVTVAPRVNERFDPDLTIRELTVWNAVRKGLSVARNHRDQVVLSADTLVAIGAEILGKPRDRTDAFRMLGHLNGRVHEVCSAVFICHRSSGRSIAFCELSRVQFRRLTDAAIRNYITKINPLDKAGAYAAQESAGDIIAKIHGSYSNVVGLPMERTIAALEQFGIRPTAKIDS